MNVYSFFRLKYFIQKMEYLFKRWHNRVQTYGKMLRGRGGNGEKNDSARACRYIILAIGSEAGNG
jgi:hypothetical protein